MRRDSKEGVVILVVVVPERGPPYRVRGGEEVFGRPTKALSELVSSAGEEDEDNQKDEEQRCRYGDSNNASCITCKPRGGVSFVMIL